MGIGDKDSELRRFDGGEYRVAFGEWFPKDESGLPVLQTQRRFGQDILVARYRTKVEGEEDGPPGSLDPLKELGLFVKAFGGDPALVPELDPSEYMQVPRLLINLVPQLKARVKVTVNDSGWISSVEGMNVSSGSYLVRFAGFTTFNDRGKPSWTEGKWGSVCWADLRVVSGEYKSSIAKMILSYPLEVNEETHQPCLVRIKGGKRDGEYQKSSQRWKTFQETFVGPVADFPVDQVEDVYNICPEVQEIALERGIVATVQVLENGLADVNSLARLPDGVSLPGDAQESGAKIASPVPSSLPTAAPKEVTESQQAMLDSIDDKLGVARVVLRQAVSLKAGGNAWVTDSLEDWTMTDAGKEWAGATLRPIVKEIGCGSKFADYTIENILFILKSLGLEDLAKSVEAVGQEGESDF